MIQRIQSVYLFGVFIFAVWLFLTPIAYVTTTNHIFELSLKGIYNALESERAQLAASLPLLILNGLIAAFSLVILFLYKNRSLQILLAKVLLFLIILLIAAGYYYYNSFDAIIRNTVDAAEIAEGRFKFGIALVFPFFMIVLVMLGLRAIKKDDELVRSADRIR